MNATTQLVSIYGLIDPRTDQLRYVGKANDPKIRGYQHVCPSQLAPDTHRNHWIKSLIKNGLKPEMTILEKVPDDAWEEAETFWIQYMKFIGCNLVNSTSGGDGGHNPSAETREKIGAASRGKKRTFSEEHKAKIAAANRLRAQNPDWCAAISNRMRGNTNGKVPRSDETKRRMSAGAKRRFSKMSFDERRAFAMKGIAARKENSHSVICDVCGVAFVAVNDTAKRCGDRCKMTAWRKSERFEACHV